MTLLEIDRISFSYEQETIFHDLSFTLGEGERVTVKGPSGIGKSTLFRLILGFETPRSGTIRFRGHTLTGESKNVRAIRQSTAWLPQDLNIGAGTVREVMQFPFTFRCNRSGRPGDDRFGTRPAASVALPDPTHELMDSFGLKRSLLDQPWANLSTGQQQRAGMILCLLLDKPILLLDEPTSALDEVSKQNLGKRLFGDRSRSILSISHDPWWLERSDRIIDLAPEF